jgi:hypothetical protein
VEKHAAAGRVWSSDDVAEGWCGRGWGLGRKKAQTMGKQLILSSHISPRDKRHFGPLTDQKMQNKLKSMK